MKKRVVSILLTAVMAVSLLAGCGGKSLEDQTAAQGGEETTDGAAEEVAMADEVYGT